MRSIEKAEERARADDRDEDLGPGDDLLEEAHEVKRPRKDGLDDRRDNGPSEDDGDSMFARDSDSCSGVVVTR